MRRHASNPCSFNQVIAKSRACMRGDTVGWAGDSGDSPAHPLVAAQMVKFGSMTVSAAKDPKRAIGHAPEDLNLDQRKALTGKFMALEVYSPATLPLRRIEAIGDSAAECIEQLRA